ncbi:hypothetical protein MMPV_009142, partial [Pyropia vietnamensis]
SPVRAMQRAGNFPARHRHDTRGCQVAVCPCLPRRYHYLLRKCGGTLCCSARVGVGERGLDHSVV